MAFGDVHVVGRPGWPWPREPRTNALTFHGDIDAVVGMGLVADRDALLDVTRLFASGFPPEPLAAIFAVERGRAIMMLMGEGRTGLKQEFIPVADGFEVEFSGFILPEAARRQGYGAKLFRNAVWAYDELGITYVVAEARAGGGSMAWARLGGAAIAEDSVRLQLIDALVEACHKGHRVKELDSLADVIEKARPGRLMYDFASASDSSGRALATPLLQHITWSAYWDLKNPELRDTLIGALCL